MTQIRFKHPQPEIPLHESKLIRTYAIQPLPALTSTPGTVSPIHDSDLSHSKHTNRPL